MKGPSFTQFHSIYLVPENPSPGYGVDLNLATGGVAQDSGSSSSGDSESESESSDAEHGISPGTSLSQHQGNTNAFFPF